VVAISPTSAERRGSRLRTYDVAVVGAGYVGLPLARVFAEAGRAVLLVDVSAERVESLSRGVSHVEDVPSEVLRTLLGRGLRATTDYDELRDAEAIVVALPTPLSPQREPDLSIVLSATREIAKRLRPGHLVVLESTTYPGTTREQMLPLLEEGSGLQVGADFNLAFSPERIDPGRTDWTTKAVPKVVGGVTAECTRRAAAFYEQALEAVHPVSTPEAAELTKLLENIFRSVNIALVNELAQLCRRMGIDVWEVIDAASTKPFGFMRFEPGPGLGGHCIPIDPFYLTWKAREHDFYTEFIELAGKVNENMPYHCRSLIGEALSRSSGIALSRARVLLVGVAYKAGVSDVRESPALKLLELLEEAGAQVAYHDPFVAAIDDAHRSVPLEPGRYDATVIVTAHPGIDHGALVDAAPVVVDLRNATGERRRDARVWSL
jgi:UDP-N-acetyl-D-glucosamine dehydrogenase